MCKELYCPKQKITESDLIKASKEWAYEFERLEEYKDIEKDIVEAALKNPHNETIVKMATLATAIGDVKDLTVTLSFLVKAINHDLYLAKEKIKTQKLRIEFLQEAIEYDEEE